MKKLLASLTLFLLLSCNSNTKNLPKPFTSAMLASQLFTVNTSNDTLLKTLHGSVIRISSGSFSASGVAEIEIREAFTPVEILAAGLTTESNGRPLRSGGMIYINATVNGDSVGLIKPINISIPNQYYDSAMQVFKGVESDSGSVNWVDPQPTDTTPQSQNWLAGKKLFQTQCRSCHRIFSDITGPALNNVEDRWSNRKEIRQWIRNWAVAVNAGYPRALEVVRWAPSSMTMYDLSDQQIDQILDYIKSESKRPGASEEETPYNNFSVNESMSYSVSDTSYVPDSTGTEQTNMIVKNPCENDTIYLPVPKAERSFLQNNTAVFVDTLVGTTNEYLRNGFTDPNPTSGMYDFEIQTLGWYNIDAYVEGYKGTSYVKVRGQVPVDFAIEMHVYLFCPRDKTLSVAYNRNGNTYSFEKINGNIPLFVGDRAILFAFGSKADKIYYGISEFRVKEDQTISINIKESSEDAIREALLARQIDGIDLGIEKKEMRIRKNPCDSLRPKQDTISRIK